MNSRIIEKKYNWTAENSSERASSRNNIYFFGVNIINISVYYLYVKTFFLRF